MTIFSDIWKSFLDMPTWVKIWVFAILIPMNLAPLLFLGEPGSVLIACLAAGGMAFNAIPLWFDRGFTTSMAIPHVILWIPLVAVLAYFLIQSDIVLSGTYQTFLIALLVIDLFSLMFDVPDTYKWIRDRKHNV